MNIKPTRSELIKLKGKIKLAKSGHNLLKKKRDGLILDFFKLLKRSTSTRGELVQTYQHARQRLNEARVVESDLAIRSLAMAIKNQPDIDVTTRSIMGVKVPRIEAQTETRKFTERGHGFFNSSAIDEAAEAYEELVKGVLSAAEVEITMRKMLAEIEKTKRRVNALEFEVIPKMEAQRKFVTLRLEEMDRETTFRMKLIKK
ncbi:MAG: V-type ATP synthase subunit D [Nanoarchaeota archaeon]